MRVISTLYNVLIAKNKMKNKTKIKPKKLTRRCLWRRHLKVRKNHILQHAKGNRTIVAPFFHVATVKKFFVSLFYSFRSFSHQRYLVVFFWSLSDSKSHQVSRTLLSILADLSNAVVWVVYICPLISKSSSL